jgi:predicted DNA-binding transcriptional regulator AlpA
MDMETDIITATIPEFRRISGISRSRIYELLDAGEIESVHIGARRLVLIDSYRRLIERQRTMAPVQAAAPRGRQ